MREGGQDAAPAAIPVLPLMLAFGVAPAAVFGLLLGLGLLRPLAALTGAALCIALPLGAALLVARELGIVAAVLAALRADGTPQYRLRLPELRRLAETAVDLVGQERLGRARLAAAAAAGRALVERLPDPLFRLDSAGAVTWRNASALAAFGTETSSLLRHPALRGALADAQRTARPVRQNIALATPVARDLDVTVIPAGEGAEMPIYLLVSDRTRERSVEKMRADFVANASHELRTPLASLTGFIETLRGPAADDREAQQRFLEIMAEQALRMQRVIADLLSLSRIEVSEHQPPEETLRLPPLLARIIAGLEPMLRASDTRLEVAVPDDLPPVPADSEQLTQLFTNLLDNAIKYGKRGGRIRLAAVPAAGDTRFEAAGVVISVADDGAGIPREHLPRLTERFYRVDKGRSRAVGGTGLGLAIVKHVVNRHRGRLLVESEPGRGAIFTVWLPSRPVKSGD